MFEWKMGLLEIVRRPPKLVLWRTPRNKTLGRVIQFLDARMAELSWRGNKRYDVTHAPLRRGAVESDTDCCCQTNDRLMDDITGQPLPPELCREARRVEIYYVRSKGVWELRHISEVLQTIGPRPISVRWADVNKGDGMHPKICSRLVARKF